MNAKEIKKLVPEWKLKDIKKTLEILGNDVNLEKAFEDRGSFDFFKLWHEVYKSENPEKFYQ